MPKSFNTSIYTFSSNQIAGLDYELLQVQQKLARITWMEAIFGRAILQWRIQDDEMAQNYLKPAEGMRGRDKYTVYFPQSRKNEQDIDLSFDDTYASRVFFYIKNQGDVSPKADDWDWTEDNVEIAQPFTMIFSGNLNKLEIESSEIVKTCLLYELNNCPKIVVNRIFEQTEDVWSDFTITQQIQSLTKFPYYCIRFDGVVTYMSFPFNGNSQFDPKVYDDSTKEATQPNINPGYPNIN